jgi:hypothetical protein
MTPSERIRTLKSLLYNVQDSVYAASDCLLARLTLAAVAHGFDTTGGFLSGGVCFLRGRYSCISVGFHLREGTRSARVAGILTAIGAFLDR